MSDEHKQYASTAAATLEAHILSVHSAKSEAEWWAQREIERLRAENEQLRAVIRENDQNFMRVDKENARLRAALKPFAELGLRPCPGSDGDTFIVNIPKASDIRTAAAALKETGE